MKFGTAPLVKAGFYAFVAIGALLSSAQADSPAVKLNSANLVDPSTAFSTFYGSSLTHTPGAGVPTTRAPELKALARALGATRYSDDQYAARVFDYVRNNIEIEFRFGLAKGARGAIIDQSGTAFDQANLMVELLHEGGVTSAGYKIGTIKLSANEFGLWSGLVYGLNQSAQTFSVDAKAVCRLLADGGIPASVNGQTSCSSVSGTLSSVTLMHIWVSVSANNKVYDPSYKRHKLKTGLDLPTALGCISGGSATCGSTIDSAAAGTTGTLSGVPYIQSVNKSAIDSQLSTYAQNLQSAIQGVDRFAQLEDVVSGGTIDVSYSPTIGTALPYTYASDTSVFDTWSGDVPDSYRTKLTVQFLGINQLLYTDELYGRRMRIVTNSPYDTWTRSNYLFIDGVQITSSTYSADVSTQDIVTLSINHPYAASATGSGLDGTYSDETTSLYAGEDPRDSSRMYTASASDFWGHSSSSVSGPWISAITVVWSVGRTGPSYQGLMASLQTNSAEDALASVMSTSVSTNILQRSHPTAAANYLAQLDAANKVIEGVSKSKISVHHQLGVVYRYYGITEAESTLFNFVSAASVTNTSSVDADRLAAFETYALSASVLEASVIQQSEDGWEATSGVSLMVRANDSGQKFLSVNSSNFSAAQSYLSSGGYSSARLSKIQDFLNDQYEFVLPVNAGPAGISLTGGTVYFGGGSLAYKSGGASYMVNQTLKGSGSVGNENPTTSALKSAQLTDYSLKSKNSFAIDATSGVVQLKPPPDLTVGAGDFPSSLSFQRTYSSSESWYSFCSLYSVIDAEYVQGWTCSYSTPGSFVTQLGSGWRHNFEISAEWANSGLEAFGTTSALRASGSIATLFSAFDLYRSSTFSRRLSGIFLGYSLSSSLMKNSFALHFGAQNKLFVRLPNGSFDAPPSEPSAQLTTNGSRNGPYMLAQRIAYDYTPTTLQYRSAQGDVIDFTWATVGLDRNNYYNFRGPAFTADKWTLPSGIEVKFEYQEVNDPDIGRTSRVLQRISNSLGRHINVETDEPSTGQFRITAVTDDTNRRVTYTTTCTFEEITTAAGYTEGCGLFSVTAPDGGLTKYSSLADTDSPTPSDALVPWPKLRKWYTPSNGTSAYLTLVYDQTMRVKTVNEGLGRSTSIFSANVADENDRMSELQNALGETTLTYANRFGNPVTVKDPLGHVTAYFYDNAQRVIEKVFPELNGVQYQYDVRSNVLSTHNYAKPGTGLSDIVTSSTFNEGSTVITCSNLKTCNRPSTTYDAKSNATSYTYVSGTGQLQTVTGPSVTNGVSGQSYSSYSYTPTSIGGATVSLLTSMTERVTGSANRVTGFTYNSGNYHVLSSSTLDQGGLNLTTGFVFDSIGNISSIDGPLSGTSDTTSYVFDKTRRLTRVNAPLNSTTRYTYDLDGQLTTSRHAIVTSPTDSDPTNPRPTDLVGSHWQTESKDYWFTGELKSVTNPKGSVIAYQYDLAGRPNLVIDPDGRRVGTVYDANGQTLCTWKSWDSTTAPTNCTWDPSSYTDISSRLRYAAYAYTDNGKQLSVQDAKNNQTAYQYDGFDRLAFTYFPEPDAGTLCGNAPISGGSPSCSGHQTYEQYGYDANGNRTSLRNRKGETISSTFDPMDRLWTKTAGSQVVTYGYNLLNLPTSIADSSHTVAYSYDTAGRKSSEATDGHTVSYAYDAANNRISTTWPDSYYISYSYDALNRMEYAHENSTSSNELAHYQYDQLSRRQSLTFGGTSANAMSYTYETDSNLLTLNHAMSTAVNFTYGRNLSGQIASIDATDGFYLTQPAARDVGYMVNKLNQYVGAGDITGTNSNGDPIVGHAWSSKKFVPIPLDDLSIIIPVKGSPGLTPDANGLDPGGDSIVHDLNGNLMRWTGQDGRHLYTYDSENRLRTAATAGSTVVGISYDYDPLGRRISKTVNGVMTRYLLDGDEEIGEYDSGWSLQRRYVTGPAVDDRIAMVDSSGTKSYYHVNHQGSVLAVTNGSGTIGDRYSYDEYGNLTSSNPTGQPFRYTGRRFDAETGLYYYRARYYSPVLGRFLQVDPIGYKDNFNLYAYSGDDPVNNTDALGLYKCGESLGKSECSNFMRVQELAKKQLLNGMGTIRRIKSKVDAGKSLSNSEQKAAGTISEVLGEDAGTNSKALGALIGVAEKMMDQLSGDMPAELSSEAGEDLYATADKGHMTLYQPFFTASSSMQAEIVAHESHHHGTGSVEDPRYFRLPSGASEYNSGYGYSNAAKRAGYLHDPLKMLKLADPTTFALGFARDDMK